MSKVEQYISEYTKNCSNELDVEYIEDAVYLPWLTPDHARRVAEIAKEEVIDTFIEKACNFLKSYRQDTLDGTGYIAGIVNDKTIEDFKNYMKGE